MLALVDELIAVISDENSQLAQGLPASMSLSAARKAELAKEFEQWVADIRSRRIVLAHADQPLRARISEQTGVLQQGMDENVERLRAAIDASRRRVDAVMRAIREQIAPSGPYQANGLTRTASPPVAGSGRWV
ncbi:flagellar protein FlgN [Phreatobacter aquaticus]|uniref:Flagellar protein FlgN n=1 Tax=Phreatobacter aquaticus TaxID=2570229 RepID=A0A4D7QUI5_9HYPH|nr:flagellar protein FlgN [Phreatobacter aquaticus]